MTRLPYRDRVGLGKTFIAAWLLARCLTPGDSLYTAGREVVLGASTLEQARLTYGFIREWLEPTGEYRFIDSAQRGLGIVHKATNTRLRAISIQRKRFSFGLVRVSVPSCIDEPGALGDSRWANAGRFAIHGARQGWFQTQGYPDRNACAYGGQRRALVARPRLTTEPRGGHTYSTSRAISNHGTRWPTIRRANPLINLDAHTRKVVLEERDAAQGWTRGLKARFLSPTALTFQARDESAMLLTVDDWKAVERRPVPEADGKPIVGADLGGGRAWSAAVAVFPIGAD